MFKIEKGVEMPKFRQRGGRRLYPYDEMEVGDSFFAEGKDLVSLISSSSRYGTRHGLKFKCSPEEGGVRVWRVA